MQVHNTDVVIVGGGAAGCYAGLNLHRGGAKTIIVFPSALSAAIHPTSPCACQHRRAARLCSDQRISANKPPHRSARSCNLMKWKKQLNGDCPRRDARSLHERCDLICPACRRCYDPGYFSGKGRENVVLK